MASPKVEALINAFRNHFRKSEAADIPIALRQEPTDVVYRSLLEEDKPDSPMLTPLLNTPSPGGDMDLSAMFDGVDMGMPGEMPMDIGAELGMDMPTEAPAPVAEGAPSVDDFLAEV